MMIIPGSAVGLAMITVVGQCIGANKYEEAIYNVKKLMKITFVSMAILGVFFAIVSPQILWVYSLSKETTNLALKCIWIHVVAGIIIWPISFTLPNALRAANDARFTMLVSIFSMWIFRYFLSFLLARDLGLGLVGVWLAMIVDWIVRSILFVYRYKGGKWKYKKLV